MPHHFTSQRFRTWGMAGIWVIFIYSTIPAMPAVYDFLLKWIPLRSLVNLFYAAAILSSLAFLYQKVAHDLKSVLLLIFALGAYLYILISVTRIPADALHFLDYTVLSPLIYRAIRLDVKSGKTYLFAMALSFLIGGLDEVIQIYVPRRGYEFHDVVTNSTGGAFGLILQAIVSRKVP